jgi:hypothetical protein
MKKKSKITHEQLVAEGVVWVPTEPRAKKPAAVVDDPIKPTTDVVAPILPKVNVTPRVTDQPRKMPEATGLQRAINANLAKGARPARTVSSSVELTGVQRAIAANIKLQESKTE